MSLQASIAVHKRKVRFAIACLAATAVLLPARAMAKAASACTAGTTLRLSTPASSQGSLLLIEVKSAKPLAEVQGDWDGRSVPFWREVASEAQRKALLGVDLEKAPGEYELKVTGQTATGEKISCSASVTVRQGRFATEKLQVGKQFVEPSPEQIKRAEEEGQKWDRFTGNNRNPGARHAARARRAGGGIVLCRKHRGGGSRAGDLHALRAPFRDHREGGRRFGGRCRAGKSRSDGTRHRTTSALGLEGGKRAGEPAGTCEVIGKLIGGGGQAKVCQAPNKLKRTRRWRH